MSFKVAVSRILSKFKPWELPPNWVKHKNITAFVSPKWLILRQNDVINRMNSTDVTAPVMHLPYSWAHKVCLNIIIISVNKFLHYRKSSYFKHIWGGFNRDRVLIWEEERRGLWYQFPIKNKNTKWKMSSTRKERSCSEDQKQIRTSSWWINHPGSVHVKFYSSYWWIQSIIYQWRIMRGMVFY